MWVRKEERFREPTGVRIHSHAESHGNHKDSELAGQKEPFLAICESRHMLNCFEDSLLQLRAWYGDSSAP